MATPDKTGKCESNSMGTRFAASAVRWSLGAARVAGKRGLSAVAALPRATMELVFPGACVSCRAEIDASETRATDLPFCDACFESLDLLHEPMCRRCGGPLPILTNARREDASGAKEPPGCYRCRGRKMWFDETIAAGLYEGRLRELLLRMKTDKGDPLSLAMGKLMWQLRGE